MLVYPQLFVTSSRNILFMKSIMIYAKGLAIKVTKLFHYINYSSYKLCSILNVSTLFATWLNNLHWSLLGTSSINVARTLAAFSWNWFVFVSLHFCKHSCMRLKIWPLLGRSSVAGVPPFLFFATLLPEELELAELRGVTGGDGDPIPLWFIHCVGEGSPSNSSFITAMHKL